ncbi:hypothetical protein ACIBSV_33775 [Embleya sp. NPDC050154]|uniref:hypothetical protein n=1 Tax=Embleya sp. NPDC050154 TaxID=3363988 RepID=UPI0037A56848
MTVAISGSAFSACRPGSRIDIRWDGAGVASLDAPVTPNGGSFSVRFVVPKGASKGSHQVSARCAEADASASFEVTTGTGPGSSRQPTATRSPSSSAVPGTGAGSSSGSGWVIGAVVIGGLLVAALAGYLGFSHQRRGPRWTRRHVRAVLRPGFASDGVQDVRDTRGASRTVRLEPRSDPGEQTIKEVDP